jgi:hypothetical protein
MSDLMEFMPHGFPGASMPTQSNQGSLDIRQTAGGIQKMASPQSTAHHAIEEVSGPSGEGGPLDTVEAPETDGLTSSELQVVVAKNPLLDPKERTKAAMSLLFGTHGRPTVSPMLVKSCGTSDASSTAPSF